MSQELDAHRAAMNELKRHIAPCVFHDDNIEDCIQYSGQVPCMTQTESDWLKRLKAIHFKEAAAILSVHGGFVGAKELLQAEADKLSSKS